MSFSYGHIAQRVFNTPLAYDERKAEAFVLGLGGRIAGSDIVVVNGGKAVDHTAFANGRPSAGRLGDSFAQQKAAWNGAKLFVEGNVAVIPVEGTLVHKGTFIGQSSGVTSYEGLQTQIGIATRDARVKGVVVEIDSFGGEVAGCFETARMLAALSKIKPTVAILTDHAFSAAYALASQCRSIIAPPFGGAGSVGVIMLHADYSGWLEKEGIKVTIVKAGAKKANGNPYEALPEETLEKWEAQANAMRETFADLVARGRKGSTTKAKVMATEAEAFTAQEALEHGLIDAIGDPSAAFDAFVKAINKV
ncbi:S49 family peptidase [uncultured Martelella sp.]|uniref:S49 family peptidase n=1 Tax=uncultured Martelella sp. TaxID=392331 RepID=UPI0029C95CC2|nr:S49 family peptidase [uncultured Martelella sp.]